MVHFGVPLKIHGRQVTRHPETASKLAREYYKTRCPAPHPGGGRRPPPGWGDGSRVWELFERVLHLLRVPCDPVSRGLSRGYQNCTKQTRRGHLFSDLRGAGFLLPKFLNLLALNKDPGEPWLRGCSRGWGPRTCQEDCPEHWDGSAPARSTVFGADKCPHTHRKEPVRLARNLEAKAHQVGIFI